MRPHVCVLIVEDAEDLRRILATRIEAEGFPVVAYGTAAEALSHLAREPFAVLLTDLFLPSQDGTSFLDRVRQLTATTRIIIYTGDGSLASAKEAIALGVSAYIEKGEETTELLQALRHAYEEYLRISAAEREAQVTVQATARRQSEDRYRSLFENAVEAIYRSTPEGRFEAVNPALVKMLGYDSAEEVYALHIPTDVYASPADREKIRTGSGIPEVVNGVAAQVKKKNGDVITVSLYSRAIYDANGAVVAYEGSAIDISEKVRTEKALQETERFARSTLDALSAHVCVLDHTGTILAVNKAWREYLAKNSPEPARATEGENYLTVCDATTGEFVEQATTFARGIRAVLNGEQERFSCDYYCPSLDHPGWFRGHVTRFVSDGPVRIVVAHEDITEQKLAEDALRDSEQELTDFFDNATVALHWVGPDGIILRVNQAELDLLGYQREEYVGRPLAEFYEDPTVAEELFCRLTNREVVRDYQARMRCKDQSVIDVIVDSSVLWKDGRFLHTRCFTRDVTDRKRVEEARRESEELFRTLAETTEVGIVISWGGKVHYVNPAVVRQSGYTREELLATPSWALVAPEYQEGMRKEAEARQRGELVDLIPQQEVRVFTKAGVERWAHVSRAAVTLQGQPALVNVIVDITDRRRMEEALRESEELFRTLTETVDVGIFIAQGDKILYANPALSRQNGYSREELLTMKPWAPLAPEFRERIEKTVQAWQRGEQVALPRQEEQQVITKGGTEQWVHVSRAFVKFHGKPSSIHAVVDITARRRVEDALRISEARFRATFEQAAVGMAHVDLEGRFFLVNQKLCDILGYTEAELLQSSCYDLTHPDDCMALKNAAQQVITGKIPSYVIEKRCIRKDGTVVWIRQTGAVVRGSDGTPLYFVDVLEDISQRKDIEAEQARLVAILENTSDFVVTTTVDGRGVYMNRAARELLGVASDMDLKDWRGLAAYTEESLEVLHHQVLPATLCTGTWSGEAVVVNPAGGEIPISQVLIAHKKEGGRADYISVIARDISEQKKAAEALQNLSHRVLNAQEQERRNLARELHDELGQVLSALKMTLQNGQRRPANLAVRVEESVAMVQTALEQVRTLSRNLRPPMLDELGLVAALRWYVKQQMQLMEVEIELTAEVPPHRFPLEIETACFRVVQEALTNILRHAQARHVWVELRYLDGQLHLLVQDDGVGFDVEAAFAQIVEGKSSGLLGMRERAQLVSGQVQVISIAGVGTEIRAMFPAEPDLTQSIPLD